MVITATCSRVGSPKLKKRTTASWPFASPLNAFSNSSRFGVSCPSRFTITDPGKTLAEPLANIPVFPPMVTHMIAVGETTGALDTMMTKIADFYDDEVDSSVGNLTAAMEPVMMVFLGGVIGFVVIAMYLPIFKMATLG